MRVDLVAALLVLCAGAMLPDAAAAQSNAVDCVKPWAVPDKWIDNHDETPPIDSIWTIDDTFETVDQQGNPLSDADVYIPATSSDPGTGFDLSIDFGRLVTLKAGDASAGMKPGWFFAIDVGSAGGAGSAYRTAIASCEAVPVAIGDFVPLLSGNRHGPTIQGVADLLALDPTAFWDHDTNSIQGSCAQAGTPCGPVSPRIGAVVFFDPALFEQTRSAPGGPQIRVSNLFGVFVDGVNTGSVTGHIVALPGIFIP